MVWVQLSEITAADEHRVCKTTSSVLGRWKCGTGNCGTKIAAAATVSLRAPTVDRQVDHRRGEAVRARKHHAVEFPRIAVTTCRWLIATCSLCWVTHLQRTTVEAKVTSHDSNEEWPSVAERSASTSSTMHKYNSVHCAIRQSAASNFCAACRAAAPAAHELWSETGIQNLMTTTTMTPTMTTLQWMSRGPLPPHPWVRPTEPPSPEVCEVSNTRARHTPFDSAVRAPALLCVLRRTGEGAVLWLPNLSQSYNHNVASHQLNTVLGLTDI